MISEKVVHYLRKNRKKIIVQLLILIENILLANIGNNFTAFAYDGHVGRGDIYIHYRCYYVNEHTTLRIRRRVVYITHMNETLYIYMYITGLVFNIYMYS